MVQIVPKTLKVRKSHVCLFFEESKSIKLLEFKNKSNKYLKYENSWLNKFSFYNKSSVLGNATKVFFHVTVMSLDTIGNI